MAGLYEYERDGDVVGVGDGDGDGDCDCDGEEREKRMFIVVGRKPNVGVVAWFGQHPQAGRWDGGHAIWQPGLGRRGCLQRIIGVTVAVHLSPPLSYPGAAETKESVVVTKMQVSLALFLCHRWALGACMPTSSVSFHPRSVFSFLV